MLLSEKDRDVLTETALYVAVDEPRCTRTFVADVDAVRASAEGNTVLSVRASGGVELFALPTPSVDAAGDYRVRFSLADGTDCYVQRIPTSVAIGPDGAVHVGELNGAPAEPGWSRVWRVEPGASGVVCPSAECSVALDGLTSVIDLAFGPDGLLYVLELDERGGRRR